MVDLRPGAGGGKGAFRVSRNQVGKPLLGRREKMRLIMFVAACALAAVAVLLYWRPGAEPTDQNIEAVLDEIRIEDTRPVDLTALPDLPDAQALAEVQPRIEDLAQASRQEALRQHLQFAGPDDPITLAWLRSVLPADRADPQIPRGFAPEDLARGRVGETETIFLTGTLVDLRKVAVPGIEDEHWYHACVEIPNRMSPLYVYVLAPLWATPDATAEAAAERLAIGGLVRVTGRYLGARSLPTTDGEAIRMPAVGARAMVQVDQTGSGDDVLDLLRLTERRESGHQGAWRRDPDIYERINDIVPILEVRPYYYLLGLTKLDATTAGVYDDPQDGNLMSFELHKRPADFREQIFRVDGIVWDAWEDQLVDRDHPYGIRRVHRIRFFKRLFNIEHEERDLEGRVTTTRRSSWHAYEVAAIVDEDRALPERGHRIEFTGRFLKVRGYPVKAHPMRDAELGIRRQSSNDYFKFFTTFDYESAPLPPPIDFTVLGYCLLVIGGSFVICMAILISRDDNEGDRYKKHVRKLRASRRNLRESGGPTGYQPSDNPRHHRRRGKSAEAEGGDLGKAGDEAEAADDPPPST